MSVNEHMIPAATVDEILSNRDLGADEKITEIEAILYPPKRPTMEDMTKDEREACQWLQCDVEDEVIRAVIINPHWESGSARVLWEGAFIEQIDWENVTPRPDLPRLEWPGDTPETPAPSSPDLPEGWRIADHEKYGRVIVTSTAPDADGNVCFVAPAPGLIGNDWHLCAPTELKYLDNGKKADQ